MARRATASAAQLRELDGAWEKVATELCDAVTFAVSQRAKDPLAAIVERLSRHLSAGSTEALKGENVGLRAPWRRLSVVVFRCVSVCGYPVCTQCVPSVATRVVAKIYRPFFSGKVMVY